MTAQIGVTPAKYWRETKDWPLLVGQTGVVVAATLIEVGLPELVDSSPYWLVLVKLDNQKNISRLKLFIGSDGHSYQQNDHVVCVLRRYSSAGNGLIHYGVKVSPAKTE